MNFNALLWPYELRKKNLKNNEVHIEVNMKDHIGKVGKWIINIPDVIHIVVRCERGQTITVIKSE